MALKEEKVPVTSGKKKASVRKETKCSFRHKSDDRAQQNQTTMPPHLKSHPFYEVEVCRRREVSIAQVRMSILLKRIGM